MNDKNLSVDEWIKKLEEEFEKSGLPKPKPGNKSGHSIIIMPKNSNFAKKLRVNEIRKYNKYEKYIIENNNLTYKELDFLLKNYANANVRETNEVENGYIVESLFQDLIYNNMNSKVNLYSLLLCFLRNELDIKKYANSIISDFHYIFPRTQNVYGMTKLILQSIKEHIDITVAKNHIEDEIDYLLWNLNKADSASYCSSSYFQGILKILENYEKGKIYYGINDCKIAIGKRLKNIFIDGTPTKVTRNRIEFRKNNKAPTLRTKLVFTKQKSLILEDDDIIYCNKFDTTLGENIFTKTTTNFLHGEKLTEILFTKASCNMSIKLIFTNKKELIFKSNGKNAVIETNERNFIKNNKVINSIPIEEKIKQKDIEIQTRKINTSIKPNVLLVYYGNEKDNEINNFFKLLEKENFKRKLTGPINSPNMKWVYVFFDTKEYIIGKPGINFSKTYIDHAITLTDFRMIYYIYLRTHSLNNYYTKRLSKKYKYYPKFCFSLADSIKHKIWSLKSNIINKTQTLKIDLFYNKYNSYEEYKEKTILSLMHFHKYSRFNAEEKYKKYEEELFEKFINKKEYLPVTAAFYIDAKF